MTHSIKVAAIDLYNNERNEGMRCIRDLVHEAANRHKEDSVISYNVFESRYKGEIPSLDEYDIFISSGGPGSPFEDDGKPWETAYFSLLDSLWNYNQQRAGRKKYIFFICHSFQMMARFFKFAQVNERFTKSFGIWGFSKTPDAEHDALLGSLNNPFYAADFRQYQVVQPDTEVLRQLGGTILATELPHENGYEQALMAVRLSDEVAGTQFHPEADADSMIYHFKQEERKKFISENFGEQKYFEMLAGLEDPEKIRKTRATIIPAFLDNAIVKLNA